MFNLQEFSTKETKNTSTFEPMHYITTIKGNRINQTATYFSKLRSIILSEIVENHSKLFEIFLISLLAPIF